jgi:prevent-host-death family protein
LPGTGRCARVRLAALAPDQRSALADLLGLARLPGEPATVAVERASPHRSPATGLAGSLAYYGRMSAVPVGDARDHFSELVAEVERTHERVTVTRHGRPVAVLLSPEDLESLEETLNILSQPGALEEIRESAADVAAGRTVSIEEVRAEFGRSGE